MADHIQIGDISPRIQYTGDGSQVAFTYPFPIFVDADIEAFEDTTQKTLTTDYTVSGAGDSAGGTVTFVTAPASGVVVTLKRNIAIARTSDFQESGEFRAKVINDELDTLTATQQQIETDQERSLRLAPTDSFNASMEIPAKASRASKVLGFDSGGDPVVSTKDMGTLESEADNAAASAAAALVSENAAGASASNASTSETNAANSASNADASATAAAASAASGLYSAVQEKSANYTLVATDQGDLIKVDATAGAVTITLEALATLGVDSKFAVQKEDAGANSVSVQRSGTDTIDGATSITISDQYELWNFIGSASTGEWTGVNTTASGISGGDGIDKTGGVLSIDLDADPGLELNAGKVCAKVGTNLTCTSDGINAPTTASQAEAEAGTATDTRIFTPELIKQAIAALVPSAFNTGDVKETIATTAPSGWLMLNGDTIGSASSGATQAHADYEALYSLFWDSMADAQVPVSSGRGASAAADFAANKTLTMVDARGRVTAGTGSGSMTTHGNTGGAETHALTTAQNGSHTHTVSHKSLGGHAEGGGEMTITIPGSSTTSSSSGSGSAHNNLQPWLALNFIIKT